MRSSNESQPRYSFWKQPERIEMPTSSQLNKVPYNSKKSIRCLPRSTSYFGKRLYCRCKWLTTIIVRRNELTPPWQVSFSWRDFRKHLSTTNKGFNSAYLAISYCTRQTQLTPFSLLNEISTLIPVSLSVNLIIGHFADFIGSMLAQMPDFTNSDVSLLIRVCSRWAGQ